RGPQYAFTGLAEWHCRISAINVGCRCKNKLGLSLSRKLKHIERSFGIHLQRLQPVAVTRNLERGEMSKNLNPFTHRAQLVHVSDAQGIETEVRILTGFAQVLRISVRQIINPNHAMAVRQQRIAEMRA